MSDDIEHQGEYRELPPPPPPPPPPQPGRFLFDHSNPLIRFWKVLVAILSIIISWAIPYHVGFVHEFTQGWKICDLIITTFIFLDFIIFSNTSYIDKVTGSCVRDRVKVVRNYGIWAFLDFISIFPFTLAILIFPCYGIAKLWIMIRLVHVRKIGGLSILKEFQHKGFNTFVRLLKLISVTFFALHLMGCLFYLVAKTNPNIKRTWLGLVEDETDKEKNQGLFLYIMSLYWSTTVLSTVGYGDVHPVNGLEMFFNTICMIGNMGFSSYVVKKVDELLFTEDRQAAKNLENLQSLRKFVGFQRLTEELRERICGLITQLKDSPTSLSDIISLLPKDIQIEIRRNSFSRLIEETYFFNGVSPSLIFQLVLEVDIETLPSEMVLIHEHEYPGKIYILVEGSMSRLGQTIPLRICGELGLFGLLPQPYTVRTTLPCTLMSLSRIRFEQLLQINKRDGDTIARNVIQNLTQQQQDPALQEFLKLMEKNIDRGEIGIPLSVTFAVERSNSRLLRQLIKRGDDLEDVNDQNQTILHILANGGVGAEVCLATVLEHANLEQRDGDDKVALSYAISSRKEWILDLFDKRGAILPIDQFRKLLEIAMSKDDLHLLKTLRRFGGDMNIANTDGNTPLHDAVYSGKRKVVEVLRELGADANIPNAAGETPFDWDKVNGGKMSDLLLS